MVAEVEPDERTVMSVTLVKKTKTPSDDKNPGGWIRRVLRILRLPIAVLALNLVFMSVFKYFLDENSLEVRVVDKLGNYY